MSDREKLCDHSDAVKTPLGCVSCVGEQAALAITMKWRPILDSMTREARSAAASDIARIMEKEVLEETERILLGKDHV
jgi:hypothetical protein